MEFNLSDIVVLSCYSKPYDFKDAKGTQRTGTSYKADVSFGGAFATFKTNEIVFKKLEGKVNVTTGAVMKLSAFNRIPSVFLIDLK